MTAFRICIDVADLDRAIDFYTRAFGLSVGRRLGQKWVELVGGACPIDLLAETPGTAPFSGATAGRDFQRHWTPIHVDVVVGDLDQAVARARAAGAALERPIEARAWGRIAILADPFGHGFCLLEMNERGYDAIATG